MGCSGSSVDMRGYVRYLGMRFFLYGFNCGLVVAFLSGVGMSCDGFVYTYLYREEFRL